jgi:hypothetical protein
MTFYSFAVLRLSNEAKEENYITIGTFCDRIVPKIV